MPGANIEGFGRKALSIALAGIYDLRQHRDEVLNPVLRQWDVFDRSGLDAEGEEAREELAAHMSELEQARRPGSRRSARRPRPPATAPTRASTRGSRRSRAIWTNGPGKATMPLSGRPKCMIAG